MSQDRSSKDAQIAEAAAWVAHLHGSKRTADSDKGLQLWLKEDPQRARVWEATTEVWDEVGNLQGIAVAQALEANKHISRTRMRYAVSALAAAAAIAAAGVTLFLRDAHVSTRVGEQRILALEDASRIFLNTSTQVVVHYSEQQRRIELKEGEALFEVARYPQWPFVVAAGDREVRALGTAFLVRRNEDQVAVTLVEGKIAISSKPSAPSTVLVPGQRLTFSGGRPPAMDRPSIEKLTAWQQGRVVIDGMRLEEAIVEMNRYSTTELALERPASAQLLISGVFRSGDSLSFANAVAATYRLHVVQDGNRILIAGDPQAAYR